jgi:hypothetical protein
MNQLKVVAGSLRTRQLGLPIFYVIRLLGLNSISRVQHEIVVALERIL